MRVLIFLKCLNYFNPEMQLKDTESTIKKYFLLELESRNNY